MTRHLPRIPEFPLYVRRGDTMRVPFRLRNRETKRPINLTGWTFRAQARADAESGSVLVTIGVVVIDAVSGRGEFVIDHTVTATLPTATVKLAAWDWEITLPSGDVKTAAKGPMYLESDVTQ